MYDRTCLTCVHLCTGCSIIQTCNFSFGRCKDRTTDGGTQISNPENHVCPNWTEQSLSDGWRGRHPEQMRMVGEEYEPLPPKEEAIVSFISFG